MEKNKKKKKIMAMLKNNHNQINQDPKKLLHFQLPKETQKKRKLPEKIIILDPTLTTKLTITMV